jgi:hypothetical protein
VYILDEDVINNHGLVDDYKILLTKEQIENMLTFEDDIIKNLFTKTSYAQKEIVAIVVINKFKNNEYVNLNKVKILSEIFGEDISKVYEDTKNTISFATT